MTGPTRHTLEVKIASRTSVARDVVLLEFVPLGDGLLPKWAPGAHIDLYLPEMVRQYSLCGDPTDLTRYRVAVLRQPLGRGGSAFVHDRLSEGATLTIGRPRNHFPLVKSRIYTFIAGGIGITPIRTMIAACERDHLEWELYYGGRSRESMAFANELCGYGDRVHLLPEDEAGLLPLADIVAAATSDTKIYCCGPEPLLVAIEGVVGRHGNRELHVERFAAPVPKHLPEDTPITVVCADSDVVVDVGAQETILDALIAAGIDVNYDCCEGTCGTCELEVLEGEADHRDAILSTVDRETSDVMYPCVSRSRTARLVLDV